MCVSIAEDGVVNYNHLSSVLQRTHSSYDKDGIIYFCGRNSLNIN
jgi:hypothetical protein